MRRLLAAAVAGLFLPGEIVAQVYPGATWQTATPAAMGMDPALLEQARDYAESGGGAGIVVRSGYVVKSWGNTGDVWELKSSTKSIGSMLVGLAIQDGEYAFDDAMIDHIASGGTPPSSNAETGWLPDVTLRQLAIHAAGFNEPPGFEPLIAEPGSSWLYSDTGADWLADVTTVAFGQDLLTVLRTRILGPIGVSTSALSWRSNWYRPTTINGIARREFGSGITASVDAMARLGYLQLRGGVWNGVDVLNTSFAETVGTPDPSVGALPNLYPQRYPGATSHIGVLWWTNADGAMADVPTDAYFSWGLFDSVILVIPSLDVVAARAGDGWRAGWDADYSVMEPFAAPIAQSVIAPVGVAEPSVSWAKIRAAFRN